MKKFKCSAGKISKVVPSKAEINVLVEMKSVGPIQREKRRLRATRLTPEGLERAAKEQEVMAATSGRPIPERKVS